MEKNNELVIMSLGFKYGREGVNHLFDVSFLKNPSKQDKWFHSDKCNDGMKDFILSQDAAQKFIEKVIPVIEHLYSQDMIRVGFACSGGRHRSVTIATEIARRLKELKYPVTLIHKDRTDKFIEKNA